MESSALGIWEGGEEAVELEDVELDDDDDDDDDDDNDDDEEEEEEEEEEVEDRDIDFVQDIMIRDMTATTRWRKRSIKE